MHAHKFGLNRIESNRRIETFIAHECVAVFVFVVAIAPTGYCAIPARVDVIANRTVELAIHYEQENSLKLNELNERMKNQM